MKIRTDFVTNSSSSSFISLGVFDADNIGRVYTIVSNDEKNIAKVEEGHLWK